MIVQTPIQERVQQGMARLPQPTIDGAGPVYRPRLSSRSDASTAVGTPLAASTYLFMFIRRSLAANGSAPLLWNKISEFHKRVRETLNKKPISHWILLLASSITMLVAFTASTLISRAYYAGGGQSYWIISWSAVVGWPLIALFLVPFYLFKKRTPSPMTFKLLLCYIGLGFISAADNILFSWAYAYLSASTASLLAASSVIFSAIFGYFIVNNKFYPSTINAIVIIAAAAAIIALDLRADKIEGVTDDQYALGFVWDILGSALHGLLFAFSELVFVRTLGRRSFHVVLELQTMVSLFAFIFTTIGVVFNQDFKGMRSEADQYKYGRRSYHLVFIWSAITFQVGILAGTAVLFLASTVLAGVLNSARVPLTSAVAVVIFHDPMSGFKILSLLLTIWGLASYLHGNATVERELP